jgi:hypothetical protein
MAPSAHPSYNRRAPDNLAVVPEAASVQPAFARSFGASRRRRPWQGQLLPRRRRLRRLRQQWCPQEPRNRRGCCCCWARTKMLEMSKPSSETLSWCRLARWQAGCRIRQPSDTAARKRTVQVTPRWRRRGCNMRAMPPSWMDCQLRMQSTSLALTRDSRPAKSSSTRLGACTQQAGGMAKADGVHAGFAVLVAPCAAIEGVNPVVGAVGARLNACYGSRCRVPVSKSWPRSSMA